MFLTDANRPVVAAVHPNLISELRERKRMIEDITGMPSKGGLTTFSELAGEELRLIRLSGNAITKEIFKINEPPFKEIMENAVKVKYVPYSYFKKLYLYTSILNRKKDSSQIVLEINKIKGLKKNEVKIVF